MFPNVRISFRARASRIRGFYLAVIALLCVAAWPLSSGAETFPSKTIRLIVPQAAGGSPDVLGRIIAQRLTEVLGAAVVVENRPGAAGIPAAQFVARSEPDGYTLLLADLQQLAINPSLQSSLPYDPVKDFTPITLLCGIPVFLVVQPDLNVNNLREFIALVKAQPGKLNYGTPGVASIHHITMEMFKSALGLDIVHIPYRGTAASVTAMLTRDISMIISGYGNVESALDAGKVKLIAVSSTKPASRVPNIEPMNVAIPGFAYMSKMGVVAPAGTPPEIVNRLASEIRNIMISAQSDPKLGKMLISNGLEVIASTPAEYAADIRDDIAKFRNALKVSGITAQ